MGPLSETELEALTAWPTPAISNATETFNVRPGNQGFMLGIRGKYYKRMYLSRPRLQGRLCLHGDHGQLTCHQQGSTHNMVHVHWDNILKTPGPRVTVIHDLDQPRCIGSLWGEVNANRHKALGCLGVVTAGGVKGLRQSLRY